eukprot:356783-Chlamydomonas_euryale.AAC.2
MLAHAHVQHSACVRACLDCGVVSTAKADRLVAAHEHHACTKQRAQPQQRRQRECRRLRAAVIENHKLDGRGLLRYKLQVRGEAEARGGQCFCSSVVEQARNDCTEIVAGGPPSCILKGRVKAKGSGAQAGAKDVFDTKLGEKRTDVRPAVGTQIPIHLPHSTQFRRCCHKLDSLGVLLPELRFGVGRGSVRPIRDTPTPF